VWIVDDSALDGRRAASTLGDLGACEVFSQGSEMLERLAAQGPPDLLVLDWHLPEIDGIELCRFVRETYHEAALPILLLTVSAVETGVAAALEAGANDYVVKPFEPVELRARAAASLRQKRLFDWARHAEQQLEREHARLEESEAKFRRLSDSGVLAIVEMDLAGNVMDANGAFLDLVGRSRADLAAGKLRMREMTAPEDAARDDAAARELVDRGTIAHFEKTLVRPDGRRVSVIQGAALVEGERRRVVAFLLDVTEQRELEADRRRLFEAERRARADAEAASRMKDEFLATVSHELRTPLNAILGWAQLAKGQAQVAQVSKALETIERNARSQSKLIGDILEISRIVSGKIRLEVVPTDLARTVEQVVEMTRPAAVAKSISLAMDVPAEGAPLVADPDRLQQIVSNLLTNAVKFTPVGGAVLAVIEPTAGGWCLRVEDTGVGIAPDFLPHVFDRFRQGDGSTTRSQGGLGLGLSIVRHLAELHGGSVRVESHGAGHGATFYVELPREAPVTSTPPPSFVSSTPAPEQPLADMTILLVDDERDSREFLALVLAQSGARVTEASSAAAAIEALDRQVPDVLVSDIGMPDEDGYSLLRRVRARPAERGGAVPAVALTAYAREQDVARAAAAGFQRHVAKPVDAPRLARVLVELAREK
jgi:PAS domain S-box-containing protein